MPAKNYQYLIIGGGMTAASAVDGICAIDSPARIGLVSAEPDPPYNRPPLTKGLWKGEPLESIWRGPAAEKADLHLGRRITQLVPEKKEVFDETGALFRYDKLLLATGGRPRQLPFPAEDFIYFRTLADYRRLHAMTNEGERFAVIGGGFIGSEIAAALAMNGKKVIMIFPGKHVGGRVFPQNLARFISSYYEEKGVELLPHEKIVAAERRDKERVLRTSGGGKIAVDGVVVGIGIEPNLELPQAAGLEIDDGVMVDEFLQTNAPGIYAAGDIASFYSSALGKRVRVEHEDSANTMGLVAGRNMAGANEPYHHLPFFYSDLFDLSYEAVGELDPRLETFADWKEPNREGVFYYMRDKRVRGVLLWNVWGQVDAARELIAAPGPFTPENLKGRLPLEERKST